MRGELRAVKQRQATERVRRGSCWLCGGAGGGAACPAEGRTIHASGARAGAGGGEGGGFGRFKERRSCETGQPGDSPKLFPFYSALGRLFPLFSRRRRFGDDQIRKEEEGGGNGEVQKRMQVAKRDLKGEGGWVVEEGGVKSK